jgi:hypothetical protein
VRPIAAALLSAGALLVTLSACNHDQIGYIEVRAVPVTATISAPLYLDTVKLEPLKNGVAVVRQRAGTAKLQIERGGQLALLCDIVVKKDRITTVTVSVLERPMRCQCRNSARAEQPQSCIS